MRVLLFSAVLSAALLHAQGYKGALLGRILDPSGRPVPAATVVAVAVATNISYSTASDHAGDYVITQLPPAVYAVRVSAPGFAPMVLTGIQVEVDQAARLDANLSIGPATQAIEVTAESPVVNTESAELGAVVGNAEILDLPLNGRDYRNLALLSAGVVPAPLGSSPFHVNGDRADHINYFLEGSSMVDRRGNAPVVQPSIDAIQEFKVLTNSFSAEYGRISGAAISVALRSGGNALHGAAYAFVRNDVFDARGFFDQSPPVLRRNQFGGVLGGPVIRDRAFFLFSYEGIRNRQHETVLARVPTPAERGGAAGAAIDPITRSPFPGGIIPAERIDPVARALLDYFPLPNRAGVFNFGARGTVSQNSESLILKSDAIPGSGHQLSAVVLLSPSSGADPFPGTDLPGFGATSRFSSVHAGLTYTRTLSPRTVNEARAAFSRADTGIVSTNAGANTSADLGIAGLAPGTGLANLVISGFGGIGDSPALPDHWTDNEFRVSDTVYHLAGRHSLRFGGEWHRSQHFNLFAAYRNGQIAFLGGVTRNPLADFLLGLPTAAQRQAGSNKSYLFGSAGGAFVQDNWVVRRNLTLNLGLRYEVSAPPVEKYDRWANFIPALGRTVTAAEPGWPRSLMRTDPTNVSPRVGLAWRIGPQGRSVIRAGYGIYYSVDLQYTMYQYLGANAFPFTRLEFLQTGAAAPLTLANPFPATPLTPGASTPSGWEYDNPTPRRQQWNFTVAREIGAETGVEAAYVGSKGTHESATININQTIRTAAGPVTPIPGYGRILWQSLGSNSVYHALQLSVRRRFHRGLAMRSSFTWSKALDYTTYGAPPGQPQDPRNLRANRGPADFNRGRVWSSAFVFGLPFGHGRRFGRSMPRALEFFAGGWQLNGILQFADGIPFTPVIAGANAAAGEPTRPDRIGSGTLAEPRAEAWFDARAFVPVPLDAYRFGNSGRNILIGPGRIQVDLSLFKELRLQGDRHRLQFRLEGFNVPNRANFGQPNAAGNLPTAGAIASASPGRQLQVALKYLF